MRSQSVSRHRAVVRVVRSATAKLEEVEAEQVEDASTEWRKIVVTWQPLARSVLAMAAEEDEDEVAVGEEDAALEEEEVVVVVADSVEDVEVPSQYWTRRCSTSRSLERIKRTCSLDNKMPTRQRFCRSA
jgi:hypothetical protein